MASRFPRFAALALVLAAGCSSGSDTQTTVHSGPPDDGLPATCNPLRSSGVCLLPFPSAVFLDTDATTKTGFRVDLGSEQFPKSTKGVAFDPKRLNERDGFSPSAEILAWFPERLDASSLPPESDPKKSLDPGSATVIVDMATGERVAHFAELDQQIHADDDEQSLILRPSARLAWGTRYAVAITKSLRTTAGGTPTAPPGFSGVLDGSATDAMSRKEEARMPDILAALAKAGVAKDDLLLAWDFVTASEDSTIASTRAVRDATLAALDKGPLGYTITSVEDDFSQHALRRVRGTFEVPKFLTQTDPANPDAELVRDENGMPVAKGTYDAPFTLILPRAATNGPVKLLQFGHGFLGSAEGELGDAGGSYVQTFADAKGYALIGTDWVGLSHYEGVDAAGSGAASLAVQDMNHIPWITDRLHQAIANGIVLARTAKQIAQDPALDVNGQPSIDASRIDYYGISLGGVMGSALLGYSPDLERAVFNVGAAGWSNLFQRSVNWALFRLVIQGAYPDVLDQQVLIEVLQSYFDPVDGMSIADHLTAHPLPGNPAKHVLLQIGVNDEQVPNLASEVYARTVPLPLLSDAPMSVFGMDPADGPLPSALAIFDLHAEAPPPGNATPSATDMNTVHADVRALPAAMTQIDQFLRTGDVVSACDGKCDPQ